MDDGDTESVVGDSQETIMPSQVLDFEVNVPTNNAFTALDESVWVGVGDDTTQRRQDKRKRNNTGSVELDKFSNKTLDEKLDILFVKVSNIEHSQEEFRTLKGRVQGIEATQQKACAHTDVNTYRTNILAYKYLDLDTKMRQSNIILYGIEERSRERRLDLEEIVLNFVDETLAIDTNDIHIIHAQRLGPDRMGNSGQNVKRPILCTLGHPSEVDQCLREARRLKGTRFAIDRDYPPEIAAARKRLWPEVKRLRQDRSANVQMKYPAKIVRNGIVVLDAFPNWDMIVKKFVAVDFRYINQDSEQIVQRRTTPPNLTAESTCRQGMTQPVTHTPTRYNRSQQNASTFGYSPFQRSEANNLNVHSQNAGISNQAPNQQGGHSQRQPESSQTQGSPSILQPILQQTNSVPNSPGNANANNMQPPQTRPVIRRSRDKSTSRTRRGSENRQNVTKNRSRSASANQRRGRPLQSDINNSGNTTSQQLHSDK